MEEPERLKLEAEREYCPNVEEYDEQTDDNYQERGWKLPNKNIDDNKQPILEPDHPLLQKFQRSLKEHLLRVKNQLTTNIAELDFNIRNKEKDRENIGAKLYDMQQEIKHQNQTLDDYAKQIDDSQKRRIDIDNLLIPLKKEYDDKNDIAKTIKQNHNEHIMELSRLKKLEVNILKWSNEVDDDLTLAKLSVTKDYQEQKQLAEFQKKTDLIIHNIDTDVRSKEFELQKINEQMCEQKNILDSLNCNIIDATSDLEILQREHNKLTTSWNDVIIAIQSRDKILFDTTTKLKKSKEDYKLTKRAIECAHKAHEKEMELNERLLALKRRVDEDKQQMLQQKIKDDLRLAKIENKIDDFSNLIAHTEKDLNIVKQEGNGLQVQINRIQHQIDKYTLKKMKVEEEILTCASDQLTTNKASDYRTRILRQIQEQRRQLELKLCDSEKFISQNLLDLEKWKGIIIKLKEEKANILMSSNELNKKSDEIASEIKQLGLSRVSKIKQMDILTKKLEAEMNDRAGQEINPLEFRIMELDKETEEYDAEIRDQQQFWLIMQGHVVNLTDKRQNQINELQIASKQMMILSQKSLRVDHELEKTEKYGLDIMKNIKALSIKFEHLNRQLDQKKKNHENDENYCELLHLDLLDKLKASELSILQLEEEICNLSKEIECSKELVLEKHREALSWESKYKIIEETVRWYRGERALESEIGTMKAEIHRMEVRYQQLKRAQEKLVQDMENCVLHRTQIFDSAMTKHKMDGNQSRARITIQYKLNDMKNKLKSIQQNIQDVEKQINDLSKQYQHVNDYLQSKQNECENERQRDILIMNEIEHGMLIKHQNLENIVRKQHRAKHYRCLSCMRIQPKIKPLTVLDQLIQKQKDIHDNLLQVLQGLIVDHPDKKFFLLRILQSLRDEG